MAIDNATYTGQLRAAVAKQLPNIVPAADAARLGSLSAALAVQNAQQTALVFNRARASAKYGPSSDQVGTMDARLKTVAASAASIRVAQASAQVQPPSLPQGSAGIFGRVTDETAAGIAGAAVVAVDQAGSASRRARTDANGAYQLVIPVRGSGRSRAPARQSRTQAPSVAVHLEVLVKSQRVLTGTEILALHAGDLTLRDLTVSLSGPDQSAK
jgi:hypothetical protein